MHALEGPDVLRVRQHVVLKMLFLLKRFEAANVRALKLALVTLHVPVELALGDELAIRADGALKLEFGFSDGLRAVCVAALLVFGLIHFHLVILGELIFVEVELVLHGRGALINLISVHVDAALVVLHLLLRLEALLALNGVALELKLVRHRHVVGVHLRSTLKGAVADFARLDESLDSALVAEVRAPQPAGAFLHSFGVVIRLYEAH
jgi:hypothetical protein